MKKYLFGYDNFKKAYEVDDYPYGFKERTQLKAWIDTHPKKGDRFVTVTLNPKTDRWNKPKSSTYSQIGVMYLDDNGHVKWNGVSSYSSLKEVEDFIKEIGGIKKLNKNQLRRYEELTGKTGDDIKWTYKLDSHVLDIRFDVVNQVKLKKIIEAVDDILKNNSKKFKDLLNNKGVIRIYGRRGTMIAGAMDAKDTYDQIKKYLKNKIKEEKEMFKIKEVKVSGKDILNAYNSLYKEFDGVPSDDIQHFTKMYDKWILDIKTSLNKGESIQPLVSLGKNYVGKKTKALMKVLGIKEAKNQSDLTNKLKQVLESKQKQKITEGMIMISSLLPVVGTKPSLSMRGNKKDNFEFKGLPGQFNEQGEKVLDEYGNNIEIIVEGSYSANEVDMFIKANEGKMEDELPALKIYGRNKDTKFLNVTFDALRQISKILKKMETQHRQVIHKKG